METLISQALVPVVQALEATGEPVKWETFDKSKTPQQWADEVKNITYMRRKSCPPRGRIVYT